MAALEFKRNTPRVGLALGGGGVRGFAHIGVLKGLQDAGIPVHVIAGSSAGAIAGSNYALFTDAEVVERRMMDFIKSDDMRKVKIDFIRQSKEGEKEGFFYNVRQTLKKGMVYTSSVRKIALINEEIFDMVIGGMVPDAYFSDLKIPFLCVALDITDGREIIFREGPLRLAVKASSAIPGIFPPVKWHGHLLVDGGWLHLVPVIPLLQENPDVIIAVDVSKETEEIEELFRGINVILRSYEVVRMRVKDIFLKSAHVVIRPDVGNIHWADYAMAEECIKRGYEAAKEKIDEIKELIKLKSRRLFAFFQKSFRKK